jgi:predicted transcriptional regulator
MELNVLGLADETQRVYLALIRRPRSAAAELARACGVSTTAATRALAALTGCGLAARSGTRPVRYTAAPPEAAVTALIQEHEHRLDAARSLVQRLADAHREATRISHPDIAVELLTDMEEISAAARRLTTQARGQVRAFDRPPYVSRPGSNLEHQVARQRSGVVHRVVYSRAAVAWPGRLSGDILPSVRAGEQARVRTELPLKLVIADDQAALIPFSLAPGGHASAYLVRPSPMLAALEALFEAEWERAVALSAPEQEAAPPEDGPDTETRALLTLLTSGMTDAAIARAQGWSARTTQRRIHRLLSLLGATTRFQAALAASRRGWI